MFTVVSIPTLVHIDLKVNFQTLGHPCGTDGISSLPAAKSSIDPHDHHVFPFPD